MADAYLSVPADAAHLGLIRLVVAQAARLAGVAQDRVADVKMAVHEAVTVALRGSSTSEPSDMVSLTFGPTARGFEVTVHRVDTDTNEADGGDDLFDLDPKLSLTLIQGLTDGCEYTDASNGHAVDLRFVIVFD